MNAATTLSKLNRVARIAAFGIVCLNLWTTANASAQSVQQRRLDLVVGEQTTISASGVNNYSVGNEAVAQVRVLPDRTKFIVVGKVIGETSLLFIYTDGRQVNYTITVNAPRSGNTSASPMAVPERVNIRLDMFYVEVNRSNQMRIGVAWPASIGGATGTGTIPLAPSGPATFTVNISQALPNLDMLQSAGWGRFLRHGTVITTNGSQADFDSGGEVYIAAISQNGATFQQLTFGSRISVTPNYDKDTGRVEVKVESEFSDLVESGSEFPGRTRTVSHSTANLALGQAFAIGGVEAHSETRGKTGIPGLSQIPILGVLFGSHSSNDVEKENVVIIVPTVVDNVPSRTAGLLDEVLGVYTDFTGDIEETNLLGVLEVGKRRRP